MRSDIDTDEEKQRCRYRMEIFLNEWLDWFPLQTVRQLSYTPQLFNYRGDDALANTLAAVDNKGRRRFGGRSTVSRHSESLMPPIPLPFVVSPPSSTTRCVCVSQCCFNVSDGDALWFAQLIPLAQTAGPMISRTLLRFCLDDGDSLLARSFMHCCCCWIRSEKTAAKRKQWPLYTGRPTTFRLKITRNKWCFPFSTIFACTCFLTNNSYEPEV